MEWFVRFRFPGYESTHLTKGIPEGWEFKKIHEVCQTIGGGTPSTIISDYWEDGDISWVSPSDLTSLKSMVLLDTNKKITKQGLEKSSAKLLPPNTILMTSRATIGYFALSDFSVCTNQGFISIIPNNCDYHYYMLYHLVNRKEELELKATGSTFKELSKSTFRKFDILMPKEIVAKQFGEVVSKSIQEIRILSIKNKILIKQRDLLLPRLMSEELKV